MLGTLHNVDLKLLRTFVTIVRCGGFTAAQAELNTNQSTISTQMSQLETRLGVRLCERGHTGFHLTPEGDLVYQAAISLFREVENFVDQANECVKAHRGEVRLGIIDNIVANPECLLDQALRKLTEVAPDIEVIVRGCTVPELEGLLLEGELHLGVGVFTHTIPSLSYHTLCHERHKLYCGPGHILFGKPESEISFEALKDSRYIEWGLKAELPFPVIQEAVANSVDSILLKITTGDWIAFLPECAADPWIRSGRLQPLLANQLENSLPVQLVTRQSAKRSRVLQFVMDLLIEVHS